MAAKTTYPHLVEPQDVDFTLRASISNLIAKTLNVAGTDADGNYVYWANTINGKYVPFSCDQFRLLDGDYVQWDFVTYVAE